MDQRHDAIGRVVGGSGILVQIHHVRPVADRSGTGHSAVVDGGLITTGDCLLVCRSGGRRTGNGRGSVQSLPGEVFEIGLCGKEATTRGLVREATWLRSAIRGDATLAVGNQQKSLSNDPGCVSPIHRHPRVDDVTISQVYERLAIRRGSRAGRARVQWVQVRHDPWLHAARLHRNNIA